MSHRRMLAQVKQGFDFNFTAAENNRLKKATENNQEIDITATADENDPTLDYECSITCAKDIPTLFIRKGLDPVFTALDKGKDLDKFIANPLLLLANYTGVSHLIVKG